MNSKTNLTCLFQKNLKAGELENFERTHKSQIANKLLAFLAPQTNINYQSQIANKLLAFFNHPKKMSITPTTLKNYYKNNCTDLVVLNMNQINNSSESNMLVTTERTIEIINQINNSSESNMLVTIERIQ